MRFLTSLILSILVYQTQLFAADFPSIPHSFQPRQLISASKIMANYNALRNGIIDGSKKINVNEVWVNGVILISSNGDITGADITSSDDLISTDDTLVGDDLFVSGDAYITGGVLVTGNTSLIGNTTISGILTATGETKIDDNLHVTGNITLTGTLGGFTQQKITNLIDYNTESWGNDFRPKDIRVVRALADMGDLKMVVLGDSTEAGVGHIGDVYAETTRWDYNGPHSKLAWSFMYNSTTFVGLDPSHPNYKGPRLATDTFPIPTLELTYSESPNISVNIQKIDHQHTQVSTMNIYYLERTSSSAPIFSVLIKNSSGVAISATTNIDTYVEPVAFGGVTTENVLFRIANKNIPISGTLSDKMEFEIFDLDMNGRGADGTVYILGFSFGEGNVYRNLSVSSTTLTAGSAANVSRGITTAGQLAKAQALDANLFFIGWGTNDSKTGVTSTPNFYSEYTSLIDDIRDTKPNAIIVLQTDPLGLASPYDNNSVYNSVIRQISKDKDVSILDVEELSEILDLDFYADNVHPSHKGDVALARVMCNTFGVIYPIFTKADSEGNGINRVGQITFENGAVEAIATENFVGTLVTIATQNVNVFPGTKFFSITTKLGLNHLTNEHENTQINLDIRGFTGYNGTGTATSWTTLDSSYFSVARDSGGGASGVTVVNTCVHEQGGSRSYEIRIQGKNFRLAPLSDSSKITWRFD